MRINALLLAAFLVSSVASAGEFAVPIPVLVDNKPLDVELMGHAAPFVVDFDGDGLKDLLIGEFYKGRLRIYRNIGSNSEPMFENFTLFRDGDRSGCIHASCCMGFSPQMIDFDGDGQQDIISGNWLHEIILFRGLSNGSFAAGEPINGQNGRPINIDYGVTAFAVDWDADGDLDLVAGTVDNSDQGNVYLVRNIGTNTSYVFAKPERLLAGGLPIVAANGGAAPVVADWDRDNKFDLILGCGDGSVRWYRNTGTPMAPEFSKYELLIGPPAEGEERGKVSKLCIIDWNEDGRLDLLVGDVGERFEKQLSTQEEQWRMEASDQKAKFLKEWAKVFDRFRELSAAAAKVSESTSDELQLATVRDELTRLSAIRGRFSEEEASLKPGIQTHGRVWLFLNTAP